MAIDRRHLQQHLEGMALAYGADLTLPAGEVMSPRRVAIPAAVQEPVPISTPISSAPMSPPVAPIVTLKPEAATPAATKALTPAPTSDPVAAAPAPAGDARAEALRQLRDEVMPCTRCKLHQSRQTVVFGEGNPHTRVLFIGEAPGAVEDRTGRPFVGPAGQLLDRILSGAMGLQREDIYIANINKCRPPGNREPDAEEVAACMPYLRRQVEILQPEVIVCLGRIAAQNLLGTTESTTAMRGKTLDYHGVPVVVTWHPAYLLRDPSHKRETWDDIKRVNRLLGLPDVPPKAPA